MRSSSAFVSIVTHAGVLLAAVIVPLLATSELPPVHAPTAPFIRVYRAAPVPVAPPAPGVSPRAQRSNTPGAPVEAPRGIQPEKPQPPPVHGPTVEFGLEVEPGVGVPDGFGIDEATGIAPPPPPPPAPRASTPVRPGGNIKIPKRIAYAAPVYPSIAQAARLEGNVTLEAVIGVDGAITNLHVVRSVPLLDHAAMDAVRQWRYTPTLLNGVPIPILMTVTVSFRLKY